MNRYPPRPNQDPVATARVLRGLFESLLPKSFDDHDPHNLTAYRAGLLLQEQCPHADPVERRDAIEEVFPELFADHWLPKVNLIHS